MISDQKGYYYSFNIFNNKNQGWKDKYTQGEMILDMLSVHEHSLIIQAIKINGEGILRVLSSRDTTKYATQDIEMDCLPFILSICSHDEYLAIGTETGSI